MFQSMFNAEGWKSVVFWATIAGWSFAILGVMSAVVAHVAKGNVEDIENAPRSVESIGNIGTYNAFNPAPVTVAAFGVLETMSYAQSISDLLSASGFQIRQVQIRSNPFEAKGVTVIPNGQDASHIIDALKKAGIKHAMGNTVPLPSSARGMAEGSVVLQIGAK